ncbi:MAG: PspC domain-containing protein [Bacteroidia bacterium]|jgi:phage shock protein C|nr:PspC domain-containing protein [Bacteroidia bacterium]
MEIQAPKRLTRTRDEKLLAGVCGGLAKYLEADPTIIRLLYVLATLFTAVFPGALIYLIMWIIVPKEKN